MPWVLYFSFIFSLLPGTCEVIAAAADEEEEEGGK